MADVLGNMARTCPEQHGQMSSATWQHGQNISWATWPSPPPPPPPPHHHQHGPFFCFTIAAWMLWQPWLELDPGSRLSSPRRPRRVPVSRLSNPRESRALAHRGKKKRRSRVLTRNGYYATSVPTILPTILSTRDRTTLEYSFTPWVPAVYNAGGGPVSRCRLQANEAFAADIPNKWGFVS